MNKADHSRDDLLRSIISTVFNELGEDADPDKVKSIVQATLKELSGSQNLGQDSDPTESDGIPMSSTRVIVTAFGQNKPGVVAAVTQVLAKYKCNIEDISQRILQDFFALILIIDMKDCPVSLRELKDELGNVGNTVGARVLAQHEDVFNYMHRV